MKIHYLESVDSTQVYLKRLLQEEKDKAPFAVVANMQTDGQGSRDNSWVGIEGNLFLSFCMPLENLPKDMKIESASIYFAYLLKMTLEDEKSKIWLKWPNDFYLGDKKIGGMITNIFQNSLVCGVGINLKHSYENFGKLDIEISRELLLKKYFINLQKEFSWKQIFSKYKLEFYKSQNFSTHQKDVRISLSNASLQDDGSVVCNNERIYSLR